MSRAAQLSDAPAVLLARDVDPADLRRRRTAQAVRQLRRGAYVAAADLAGDNRAGGQLTLATIEAVHQQLRIPFVFSHESAALVWGCAVWPTPTRTHIIQADRPNRRGDPQLVRHHGLPPSNERTVVAGLPVTTLERTVIDCAAAIAPDRALVIADGALRRGADRDRMVRLMDLRAGHRGIRRARLVVELADAGAESPGESLTRWVLASAGFDAVKTQVPVVTRLGVFRIDLGLVAARLAIEFDGFVKYSGALGSTAPEAVFAEKRRQDALEEAGWMVLRVTWSDLRDPDALVRRVRSACRRAAQRQGAESLPKPGSRPSRRPGPSESRDVGLSPVARTREGPRDLGRPSVARTRP